MLQFAGKYKSKSKFIGKKISPHFPNLQPLGYSVFVDSEKGNKINDDKQL